MNHINEHSFQSKCLKCTLPVGLCTHDLRQSRHWLVAVSITSWSKSNQVCIQRFCRSSTSWIVLYMPCCITPQISKFKDMMILVHFGEAVIHLMQFSLVISRCNITFLVFWLSRGSVATSIRWGGWVSNHYACRSFLYLTVKTVLKSVSFWRSYIQKQLSSFYGHGVFTIIR